MKSAFYPLQTLSQHFSGYTSTWNRFGSLAVSVGPVAKSFAKIVLLQAVKSVGNESFDQSLAENVEVSTNRKTPGLAGTSAIRRQYKTTRRTGDKENHTSLRYTNVPSISAFAEFGYNFVQQLRFFP